MSRVYVAGKFEDSERVREVQAELRDLGHEITYDWTRQAQVSVEQARADISGVMTADFLVMVLEKEYPYKGTWVEMGIAIGGGLPIFVLGSAWAKENIFLRLPSVHPIYSVRDIAAFLAHTDEVVVNPLRERPFP